MPIVLVATTVIARVLGPSAYGTLAFWTTAMAVALAIANLGFPMAAIQWGAAAEARAEREGTRHLISDLTGFYVVVELPLILVTGWLLLGHEALWLQAALAASLTVTLVLGAASIALHIENRTATDARIAMAVSAITQTAAVVAAVLSKRAGEVWIAKLAGAAVGPLLIIMVLEPDLRRAMLRPRLPRRMPSGFWRFALGAWAAATVSLAVFSRSEIFVLRRFGTAKALGVFALAFGVSYQLTAPVDGMLAPLLPGTAGLVAAHIEHAQNALLRALRFTSLASGAINAVVLPAAVFLVPLVYGHRFAEASAMLLPLGLISTLQSTTHPITAFTFARRRAGWMFKVGAIALVGDVALALALIPALGAWGAVIANACAQALALTLLTWGELRAQRIDFRRYVQAVLPWLISVLAAGLAVGTTASLTDALPSALAAVGACAIGTSAYLLGVRLSPAGLTDSDSAALLEVVPGRLQPATARLLSWLANR